MWFPLESYDPTSAPQTGDVLSDRFQQALPGCVGLWLPSLDDRGKALDFNPTPSKNPGAINGGITTVPGRFGVLGAAWSGFSAATPGVTIQDPNSTLITPAATIAAVFSTANGVATEAICSKDDTGSNLRRVFQFRVSAGVVQFIALTVAGGARTITGSTNVADGKMHLAVAWLDNTSQKLYLYVDGQQDATPVATLGGVLPQLNNRLTIGFDDSGGDYLSGQVGSVAIFDGPFTGGKATALHNCLLTGEPFPLFAPQVSDLSFGSAAAPTSGLLLRRRRAAA